MISKLEGSVSYKNDRFSVINVGGVGYKVYASPFTLGVLKEGSEVRLWTHLSVKETALELYGFERKEELDFFELLITVSGIGPKSALAILSVSTIESIRRGVVEGDISYLTKVSGIGKKIAEKIMIELKDKLGAGEDYGSTVQEEVEVIEALKALGYSHDEARKALKDIPQEISGTGERVKYALKNLGK